MSFYDRMQAVYDDIFPENKTISAFIRDGLRPGSRVLDLACGTGTYACSLAAAGHDVTGIDLDGAVIERANKKCGARFFTGDMRDFQRLAGDGPYDRIYCVGNSIPHLPDREAVSQLCRDVYAAVAPGGDFIMQTVNFRALAAGKLDILPPIERPDKGLRFLRRYTAGSESAHVRFEVELTVSDESWRDSVSLLILDKDDITGILTSAGFNPLTVYGDYAGSPYRDDSPALVIKATKKE